MGIVGTINSYQNIEKFYVFNSNKITDNNSNAKILEPINTNDDATTTTISPEAIELLNAEQNKSEDELTQKEQQELTQLKTTDAEVKRHENAHKAMAAGLQTSGPNYEYEVGPDGKKYAVAGDVNISYQKSSDPKVNLKNAQKLKAAALAPADPSAQDRSVARKADAEIAKAQQEILDEQQNKDNESNNSQDI